MDTPHDVRPWPTHQQVRTYYKMRAIADQQIGRILSKALQSDKITDEQRANIEFWMEFYPDCRF